MSLAIRFSLAFVFFLPLSFQARTGISAPTLEYTVVAKYPHSTANYTEGFLYLDGHFYEGTGLRGNSAVVVTEPQTGRTLQQVSLPEEYFGEGLVDWGPYLFEWTWQSHVCFVYERRTLRLLKQFTYAGEGWGMTRTAKELITSDGTATLRFRSPDTFKETHHITVNDGGKLIDQLNELEYIKNEIYANVWHSDRVARISPRDGHVISWIDFAGLLPDNQKPNDESVLNGIAYDSEKNRLFITGKQWPVIFEVKIHPHRL